MPALSHIGRRLFLKTAGATAVAGVTGASATEPAMARSALQSYSSEFDFDTVYSRIGTNSSKWDAQIARYGREHVDVGMGTADQDFRIAPPISAALRQRVEHENYGYMAIPESYYESIIDWNTRRYGLEIARDSIRNSDGVHTGIISTLRAFCPPGSKVLMNTPTYDGFYSDIRIVGLVAEESPMKVVDGKYKIDFADLERRIDHETHAFILCNPHNPTGNLWSREDLMTLGEICTKRRVVVLADEIHCDFVAAGNTYTPYATLDDEAIVRNSITYKSVSKSFNLSSLKCAYLFSTNPDYLTRITGAGQHRQSMNTLGIVAAEAAYNHCEDWLDQVITYIDGTTDYVEQFVGSRLPGVSCIKPEGTYLSWLDMRPVIDRIGARATATAADADTTPESVLQQYLVDHANIHINPGSNYGLGGSGHMRMNLATSRSLVEMALHNLASALG